MMFSLSFVTILIWTALVWTGLGAVVLITLIIRDHLKGEVW